MKTSRCVLPLFLLAFAAACDRKPVEPADVIPAGLFVDAPPAGAQPVTAARAAARAGDELVLRGRIGGRKTPFGASSATFLIVDPSIEPCPPDEGCPTPWDCCCLPREEIAANSATIQISGGDGEVLPQGVEGSHGLEPLTDVTVAGTVRSTDGGLVVDAVRIHVAR